MADEMGVPPAGVASIGGTDKKKDELKIHPAVKIEEVGPCKKKLVIEVPVDDVVKSLQKSIGELRRQAILPGFRKGHAPLALIEKRFGQDMRKEVKANLVVEGYKTALEQNKLEPIAEPDVDFDAINMAEDEPLKYELTVEVWPEFEIKRDDYEGLKLTKPSTAPTPEEIDAEIHDLRVRTTNLEEIKDEGAAATDYLICDYKITCGEEEIGGSRDGLLRPESGEVEGVKIDQLKTELVGVKAGDTVNIAFKIADDCAREELRGKDTALSVNVKGVRRPHVPEADDKWADELGFKSLEELKTVLTRNVEISKESNADAALRQQIYERLVDMLKFDLPEDAVRRQQKDVFKRERVGLQYRGATEEDLAKINDKLEEASLEKAQLDLKLFFILSKIANAEKVTAGEADVEMRIAELATRYRSTVAKVREHLKREEMLPQIALEIREEKTVAHILSKAEISQAPAPPAAAQALSDAPETAEKPRAVKSKKAGRRAADSEAPPAGDKDNPVQQPAPEPSE